ncbi:hypothetical protein [Bradyrhizobium canariense]|uniref:hypothetical protein n=1 Tax=Bradyrhizobium canariense TaxID=255045 RepID=UPI001177BED0|nr:hypothetical protein [Bradyrhizobium canariense]
MSEPAALAGAISSTPPNRPLNPAAEIVGRVKALSVAMDFLDAAAHELRAAASKGYSPGQHLGGVTDESD